MDRQIKKASDVVIIDSDEDIWEYKSLPKRLKQTQEENSDDTYNRQLSQTSWIDNLEDTLHANNVVKHKKSNRYRNATQSSRKNLGKNGVKIEPQTCQKNDKKKILGAYKSTISHYQTTDNHSMHTNNIPCKSEKKCRAKLKQVKTESETTPSEKCVARPRTGNCPVCCMPFTALSSIESPSWHVDMCLDEPNLSKNDCPEGNGCDSNIISHYKQYRHSVLSRSLRKQRNSQSGSLGNMQNAKIWLNFGNNDSTTPTVRPGTSKDMSVNVTLPRGSSPSCPVEINVSCTSDTIGESLVEVNVTCSQATATTAAEPVVTRRCSTLQEEGCVGTMMNVQVIKSPQRFNGQVRYTGTLSGSVKWKTGALTLTKVDGGWNLKMTYDCNNIKNPNLSVLDLTLTSRTVENCVCKESAFVDVRTSTELMTVFFRGTRSDITTLKQIYEDAQLSSSKGTMMNVQVIKSPQRFNGQVRYTGTLSGSVKWKTGALTLTKVDGGWNLKMTYDCNNIKNPNLSVLDLTLTSRTVEKCVCKESAFVDVRTSTELMTVFFRGARSDIATLKQIYEDAKFSSSKDPVTNPRMRRDSASDIDNNRNISDMLFDALSDTDTCSNDTQIVNTCTQELMDRDCTVPTRSIDMPDALVNTVTGEFGGPVTQSKNKTKKISKSKKHVGEKVRDMSPESIFHSSSDESNSDSVMDTKNRDETKQLFPILYDLDDRHAGKVRSPCEFLNSTDDFNSNAKGSDSKKEGGMCTYSQSLDDSSSDDSDILFTTMTQNKIIKPKPKVHTQPVTNVQSHSDMAGDVNNVHDVTTKVENSQKPVVKFQSPVSNKRNVVKTSQNNAYVIEPEFISRPAVSRKRRHKSQKSQIDPDVMKSDCRSQSCLTRNSNAEETSQNNTDVNGSEFTSLPISTRKRGHRSQPCLTRKSSAKETSRNNADVLNHESETESKHTAKKHRNLKKLELSDKELTYTQLQKPPMKRGKVDKNCLLGIDKKDTHPTIKEKHRQLPLKKKGAKASKTRSIKSKKQKSQKSKPIENLTVLTDEESDESLRKVIWDGRHCCLKCTNSQKSKCATTVDTCMQKSKSVTSVLTQNSECATSVNVQKRNNTTNVNTQKSESNTIVNTQKSHHAASVNKQQNSECDKDVINVIANLIPKTATETDNRMDVDEENVVESMQVKSTDSTSITGCDPINVGLCRRLSMGQFEGINPGAVIPTPPNILENRGSQGDRDSQGDRNNQGDNQYEMTDVLPGGFFPEGTSGELVGNNCFVYNDIDGDGQCESAQGNMIVGGVSPDKRLSVSVESDSVIGRDINSKYTQLAIEGKETSDNTKEPVPESVQYSDKTKPKNVFDIMMSRSKKLPSKETTTIGFKQPVAGSSRNATDVLMANRGKQKDKPVGPTNHKPDYQQGSNRNCPFYKKIQGTGFTVDAFNYGVVSGCTAYFLTHFHYDHYGGLTRQFSQPIYCSKITANLVSSKLRVAEKYLHVIPLDTPTDVQGTKVTFVDANHCPGSVIIVFQLPSGRVYLHTGDFRGHPSMEQSPHLASLHVNTLYLDTTYCDAQYIFPPQEEVINFTVKLALEARANNPKTLIVCGSYTIGKERIFTAIAEALDCRICVARDKKAILDCQEDPALHKRLSLDWGHSGLHVLPMNKLNIKSLGEHLMCNGRRYNSLLAFEPTGWTFSKKLISLDHIRPKVNRDRITVYGVPYSEHSSFLELRRFVQFTCPDTILPTVNNGSGTNRRRMQVFFDSWLEEARRRRKAQ